MRADQIVENAELLKACRRKSCSIIMGRLPQPAPLEHRGVHGDPRMLDKGRTWMKLSGAYMDTNAGAPAYADKLAVAQAFHQGGAGACRVGLGLAASDREEHKPDDATLFDLLADWAPDAAQRQRILVTNPETLYGF